MTIKAEILIALGAAESPLTARQIEPLCQNTTVGSVVQILSALKAQGLAEHAGKSEPADGERVMTLWRLTAAGREVLQEVAAHGKTPRGGGEPEEEGEAPRQGRAQGATRHEAHREA